MTNVPDAAWYVAYGSNMLRSRMNDYISGGSSMIYGSSGGARDKRPPLDETVIRLHHSLYVAGHSIRWGSGVAFLRLEADNEFEWFGRAFLVRWSQIEDIACQENGRSKCFLVNELPALDGYQELHTKGKYNALLRLPDIQGVPALTVTTSRNLALEPPSPAYVRAISDGLSEMGLPDVVIESYLARLQRGQ